MFKTPSAYFFCFHFKRGGKKIIISQIDPSLTFWTLYHCYISCITAETLDIGNKGACATGMTEIFNLNPPVK